LGLGFGWRKTVSHNHRISSSTAMYIKSG
jgi:hypothetical protein